MTAIIDYGVGNLFSLKSSLEFIGESAVVTGDKKIIEDSDRIILPGVGAFGDAIEKLKSARLDAILKEQARDGKPLLGICLGMQLLFTRSYEYGRFDGLGLIPGSIRPLRDIVSGDLDVPHVGWNALHFTDNKGELFKYTENGEYVYFVHSYYAAECGAVTAYTDYSVPVTAAVQSGRVFGAQFHPEKSGGGGLKILKAFCEVTV